MVKFGFCKKRGVYMEMKRQIRHECKKYDMIISKGGRCPKIKFIECENGITQPEKKTYFYIDYTLKEAERDDVEKSTESTSKIMNSASEQIRCLKRCLICDKNYVTNVKRICRICKNNLSDKLEAEEAEKSKETAKIETNVEEDVKEKANQIVTESEQIPPVPPVSNIETPSN